MASFSAKCSTLSCRPHPPPPQPGVCAGAPPGAAQPVPPPAASAPGLLSGLWLDQAPCGTWTAWKQQQQQQQKMTSQQVQRTLPVAFPRAQYPVRTVPGGSTVETSIESRASGMEACCQLPCSLYAHATSLQTSASTHTTSTSQNLLQGHFDHRACHHLD
jgi:hypothetical protein